METVNRILQEKITARIAPNKAVLIFGARRVGKTVMMRKIVDNKIYNFIIHWFTATYSVF